MMQDDALSNPRSDSVTEAPTETVLDSGPQFGLIDVVEAFTSLRHEYRSQVKETRELASGLTQSTERIAELETVLTRLTQKFETTTIQSNQSSTRITEALVDFDIQLSRAIEVAIAQDERRRSGQTQQSKTIHLSIARISRWRRWAAGPVIEAIEQQLDDETDRSANVIDGLSILLAKLRQTLVEYQIERIETIGEPFNGETMKSIGQLPVDGVSAGHVTEQLSPGYRCEGEVIRFATVRVSP